MEYIKNIRLSRRVNIHFICLILLAICLSCSSCSSDKKEQFDVNDFNDNTHNYKGYNITWLFRVNTPIFTDRGDSLRKYIGRDVQFTAYGSDKSIGPSVTIHLPKGLSVPNAGYIDMLIIEFSCNGGSLRYGNEAISIKRPPKK